MAEINFSPMVEAQLVLGKHLVDEMLEMTSSRIKTGSVQEVDFNGIKFNVTIERVDISEQAGSD